MKNNILCIQIELSCVILIHRKIKIKTLIYCHINVTVKTVLCDTNANNDFTLIVTPI